MADLLSRRRPDKECAFGAPLASPACMWLAAEMQLTEATRSVEMFKSAEEIYEKLGESGASEVKLWLRAGIAANTECDRNRMIEACMDFKALSERAVRVLLSLVGTDFTHERQTEKQRAVAKKHIIDYSGLSKAELSSFWDMMAILDPSKTVPPLRPMDRHLAMSDELGIPRAVAVNLSYRGIAACHGAAMGIHASNSGLVEDGKLKIIAGVSLKDAWEVTVFGTSVVAIGERSEVERYFSAYGIYSMKPTVCISMTKTALKNAEKLIGLREERSAYEDEQRMRKAIFHEKERRLREKLVFTDQP